MNKLSALLVAVAIVLAGLTGCTPRPNSAQPAVDTFLDAVASQDYEELSRVVDEPEEASDSIRATWQGLQAEGAEVTLNSIQQKDNFASASYSLHWRLPRERSFSYDAELTLTQAQGQWNVRWKPSVLNPRLGAHQHLELRAAPAAPASVVSSDGVELLKPGVVYRVLVDTAALSSPSTAAAAISAALGRAHGADGSIPVAEEQSLAHQLENATGTFSVAVLAESAVGELKESLAEIPGVRLNEEEALVTVDQSFAPDVMARVGEVVGDDLQGKAGWSVNVVNADGVALEEVAGESSQPSPAIHVSLDHKIQRAAERALEPLADQQAMIVAIRPSTGGILAVAQTPAADRDGNIATTGQYPPGSTFKIVTAAAGMKLRGLTPDSTVACPSTQDLYGRVVTNYAGFSLGDTSLRTAFARSCNTTFADLSTHLEPGQLADVGKQFGLGIDFDIPGLETVTGSIPHGEKPLERTEAGYGQGHDLASPFAMALVSATAARGATPRPFLIDSMTTQVSEEIPAPSTEWIEPLREMMAAVTAPGGTASGMSASGDIRGKTGEAEINLGSHSWFTGYRVDDDIAFATLIVLGGGSEVAVGATDRMLLDLDAAKATDGG